MSIFSYVCWPHICLLLKNVCSSPSPTFEWACLFFSCKSVLVLYRFWIVALCQMRRLQTFFPHSVGCQFTLMMVSCTVYVMDYIYGFAYVEPAWHSWDEAYLIMVDNLLDMLLQSVSQYFIEDFCINVHRGYWPEVFFFS